MNDSAPLPSRRFRAYYAGAKWLLWLLLAAWLLFALAWGALHGFIVPNIAQLRPDLEIEASRVLGIPVRIGAITARTEGLVPSFELSDVQLLDAQGREALRLPRVIAALSPRSLWNLGFEQLYIDGPVLDIRRAADGRVFVAGLDFSNAGNNDGQAADWFFSQREFVIRGGTLRWTDELRKAPPLALTAVDFVSRNDGRRHALRLDATPPQGWGRRFDLRGLFRHPVLAAHKGDWRRWDGEMYGDFAGVDVSALGRYSDFGAALAQGNGSLRFWTDVKRGEIQAAVADVALAEVAARLGQDLEPLALDALGGRLGGRRIERGFEFSTQSLAFHTRNGLRWPGGDAFVRWQDGKDGQAATGDMRATNIDLAAVGEIAKHLPLGTATHAALTAYAPQGLVENLQANWEGAPDALRKYRATGRVSRVSVEARARADGAGAGSPGLRNATIDFDLDQEKGKARLAIASGSLEFPGVFEEPVIPFESLAADLQWRVEGQKVSATVSGLRFANADTQGEAEIRWRTSDGAQGRFPGVLDLQGGLARADAARVHRYLPLTLSRQVREYVQESITQGQAQAVKFRVRGDLRDMPFTDPKTGEFRVTAALRDLNFAYVPRSSTGDGPAWPALTQLGGELVFERRSMRLNGASARFAPAPALQATRIEARIADLARQPLVEVTADVKGQLPDALGVVESTPLATLTSHALDEATATGPADIRLAMAFPLQALDKSRVSGTVTLAGNDVRISPETPALTRARGAVTFSDSGFAASNVQARLLGGDARLDVATARAPGAAGDLSITLKAQGTATAEALRQAQELGAVSRLARFASGSAAYATTLAIHRNATELSFASNLQGLALNLPPPLNKPADSVLALRVENTLLPGNRAQDQVLLELGRLASASFVRDISGAEPRVLRGAIGVGLAPGEQANMPEQGVAANLAFGNLDLDVWESVLAGASAAPTAAQPAPVPPAPASAPRSSGIASAAAAYLPTTFAVRARELTVGGRKLHDLVAGGARSASTWRANLHAVEANGYFEYQQGGSDRVLARLARLSLAQSTANEVESLLTTAPARLPALDIVVDELELKGRDLGRFELQAGVPAAPGGVRDWRVDKLSLAVPEATFTASGNWAAASAGAGPHARRRMQLDFKLDVADSGKLLTRFGMKDVLRNGKGKLEGRIGWTGSPLAFDYPSMDGVFNVDIQGGQFLKADPGLAKLLSVLSLQSLPRRLILDFRDVFSQGFAFDFVRGDVTIEEGIAATNNLQMKGSTAAVLMDGKADIARETQDVRVVVVPELDAGTASLLVATAINPVLGLSSYLAQLLFRRPLIAATTQEFHIDGTWSDPRITKVPRSRPAASAAEREREPAEPRTPQ